MFLSMYSRHTCRVAVYLLLASFAPVSSSSAQTIPAEQLQGLTWRLSGPFRGGRVTTVAGIPGDAKTYYMGTPGGGVWKTTDACSTWVPIFDGAHVASIGGLVVAPSNPNVIYVATGEQTEGTGVWKSTDAGATWTNIGLGDSHIIPSILVDPHDANLVYVAAAGTFTPSEARGIFKSTDGGKTWRPAALGSDEGKYSFRQWNLTVTAPNSGKLVLQARCTNTKGEMQPAEPNWNGGGFMRNVIEQVALTVT